jgi:hypothetical protein
VPDLVGISSLTWISRRPRAIAHHRGEAFHTVGPEVAREPEAALA